VWILIINEHYTYRRRGVERSPQPNNGLDTVPAKNGLGQLDHGQIARAKVLAGQDDPAEIPTSLADGLGMPQHHLLDNCQIWMEENIRTRRYSGNQRSSNLIDSALILLRDCHCDGPSFFVTCIAKGRPRGAGACYMQVDMRGRSQTTENARTCQLMATSEQLHGITGEVEARCFISVKPALVPVRWKQKRATTTDNNCAACMCVCLTSGCGATLRVTRVVVAPARRTQRLEGGGEALDDLGDAGGHGVLAVLHDEEMRLAVALEVVIPARVGECRCKKRGRVGSTKDDGDSLPAEAQAGARLGDRITNNGANLTRQLPSRHARTRC